MSREIKFRAWEHYFKRMHYQGNKYDGEFLADILTDRNRFTPMQYTGLKDKNGVELYFDDVIFLTGFGTMTVSNLDNLVHLINEINDFGMNFSVFGNIHQNPELLEGN